MTSPLASVIQAGTKVWLDSIDPDAVAENRSLGITGATSNPIIISDLVKTGQYDDALAELMSGGKLADADVAWNLTNEAVSDAQRVFRSVWDSTKGDDGYVSFELDPLLEDVARPLPHNERVSRYIELGTRWSTDQPNRMIKIPATPAGIDALEELAARGVTINVTLCFSMRQYIASRDAIWRGAQRRKSLQNFKSVYSIFISRIDVYTAKHVPSLSPAAQGQVGIVNAKNIWRANEKFWGEHPTTLKQEIVFASTGAKLKNDAPWKYVEALVGSGIQTNPPATNQAVEESGRTFHRTVDQMPPAEVLNDIEQKVDFQHMEDTLMEEGLKKFADPQKALLALIAEKRTSLARAS